MEASSKDADHEINISIITEDVKDYAKRSNVLNENVKKLYSVIWGPCQYVPNLTQLKVLTSSRMENTAPISYAK